MGGGGMGMIFSVITAYYTFSFGTLAPQLMWRASVRELVLISYVRPQSARDCRTSCSVIVRLGPLTTLSSTPSLPLPLIAGFFNTLN